MNQANEMVKTAYAALSDKKGEDISIIDISGVSVMADYFIIASGSNSRQVQAMADSVELELSRKGYACGHVEGYRNGDWILMDYGDMIIHIFDRDNRLFYDLERIWCDGKTVLNL